MKPVTYIGLLFCALISFPAVAQIPIKWGTDYWQDYAVLIYDCGIG